MFEPAVARVAAARVTDEDLADLQRILDTQRRKLKAGGSAIVEDTAFHAVLARATRNRVVMQHHGDAERSAGRVAQADAEAEGPARALDSRARGGRRGAAAARRRRRRATRCATHIDQIADLLADVAPTRHLVMDRRRCATSATRSLGQLDDADSQRGPSRSATLARSRRRAHAAWQQDCAAAINQLSGGSKAHWLARAYSSAFSCAPPMAAWSSRRTRRRSSTGFSDVLAQGAPSLSRMDDGRRPLRPVTAPRPRRFDFVHDAELRPVLEQAFVDSRARARARRFRSAR